MKKSPVVSSSVATRDGDIITPRPMATYTTGPSQRAVIRDAQPMHHIERDRREKMVLLRHADYYKPEAHMSDITIFFVGLMAGLTSPGLVFIALHLGVLL